MSYRQLMNDIKTNSIKSVYLIYGSETYLIDKGWEALKNALVTSFPELNYTQLDGEKLDISELSAACETFPFGADKRLVAVRDLGMLKSKGESKGEEQAGDRSDPQPFVDIIRNIGDTTCLLFVSYGSIDKRKKLVNELKKYGGVYEFDRIDRDELAQWIKRELGKSGKSIGARELDYFINSTGYIDRNGDKSLYDVENEVGKLVNYTGKSAEVRMEHIEAVVPRNPENDIFKLINACSEKDVDRSLRVYGDLLLEGESSLGILALLTKQIKNMIGVAELHNKRYDGKSISEKLKIHEYTVKLCIKYSAAIKSQVLHSAFGKCLDTEFGIKTGRMEDRLAMELLLVTLFEQ
ncbi:MAG TPA: DNA polymerase III subunit delta [Clostridia bacterium]|nr:DNA polymerase III subunit delta [Clostridia bacterium]